MCLVAALGLTACANLKEEAKIKKNEATTIALKQTCGIPKRWEIQKKNDQLTWLIDVRNPDTLQVTRVAIDANNGNVINSNVRAKKCD